MVSLFIQPERKNDSYNWSLESLYGHGDPVGAITVSTSGQGNVYATTKGFLSVLPSELNPYNPFSDEEEPPILEEIPSMVDIVLRVHPTLLEDLEFQQLQVSSFLYMGISAPSLLDLLGESVFQKAFITDDGPLTVQDASLLFFSGLGQIPVDAGTLFGKLSLSEPSNRKLLKFACLTQEGAIDPVIFYIKAKTLLNGEKESQRYQQLMNHGFLKVGITDLDKEMLQEVAGEQILPFGYLTTHKKRLSLNYQEWRAIGDAQKNIYLAQLKSRYGISESDSSTLHFKFNNLDVRNIFQLESIVEFFANFSEPNQGGAVMTEPSSSNYIDVNFLSLEGSLAQVEGNVITISDSDIDINSILQRNAMNNSYRLVKGLQPLIYLEEDTNRATKTYRLDKLKNRSEKKFSIKLDKGEQGPAFPSGVTRSAWKIIHRPTIALIDPLGPRLMGSEARIVGIKDNKQTILSLDIALKKLRVNKDFDSIYLEADRARATKKYRIIRAAYQKNEHNKYKHAVGGSAKVPNNDGFVTGLEDLTNRILIQGVPDFGQNDTSKWSLPAGLGGVIPTNLQHFRSKKLPLGYDLYEGWAFVIYDGEVLYHNKLTSYSSRKNLIGSDQNSSIQGNRLYYYYSHRSGKKRGLNYCLKIIDNPEAVPTKGYQKGGDHCRDAKRYFLHSVVSDSKQLIRMHNGLKEGGSTGSEGCQVTPDFFRFRNRLLKVYAHENVLLGKKDAFLEKLIVDRKKTIREIWDNHTTLPNPYKDKLNGAYWLIRPDERIIGTIDQENVQSSES